MRTWTVAVCRKSARFTATEGIALWERDIFMLGIDNDWGGGEVGTFVAEGLKYTAEERARRGAAADMVRECCKY